jgi:ankyrin repeat protein
MYAARKGRTDIVSMLLSAGADASLQDSGRRTAHWWARSHNKPETAQLIQRALESSAIGAQGQDTARVA